MSTKPKFEEIQNMTADIKDGLTNAASPSAANAFATNNDVSTAVGGVPVPALDAGGGTGATFFSFDFSGMTSVLINAGLEGSAGDAKSGSFIYIVGTDTISGHSSNGDAVNSVIGAGSVTLITGGALGNLSVAKTGTVLEFSTSAADEAHVGIVGI